MADEVWKPEKVDYALVAVKQLWSTLKILALNLLILVFTPFGLLYCFAVLIHPRDGSWMVGGVVALTLFIVAFHLSNALRHKGFILQRRDEPLAVGFVGTERLTRAIWSRELGRRMFDTSMVLMSLLVSYVAVTASIFTCRTLGGQIARDKIVVQIVDVLELLLWHVMAAIPLLDIPKAIGLPEPPFRAQLWVGLEVVALQCGVIFVLLELVHLWLGHMLRARFEPAVKTTGTP